MNLSDEKRNYVQSCYNSNGILKINHPPHSNSPRSKLRIAFHSTDKKLKQISKKEEKSSHQCQFRHVHRSFLQIIQMHLLRLRQSAQVFSKFFFFFFKFQNLTTRTREKTEKINYINKRYHLCHSRLSHKFIREKLALSNFFPPAQLSKIQSFQTHRGKYKCWVLLESK